MFNKKSSNSQTFFNFWGTVTRSCITFITMPIFTRLLGAEQYGYYSVYNSWLLIFSCFMGINTGSCLGTGRLKYGERYEELRSNSLIAGSVISLPFIAILILFHKSLCSLIGIPIHILCILIAESFAQYIIRFSNIAWTYEKKSELNMLFSSLLLLCSSIISIFAILNWRDKKTLYYGQIYGTAATTAVIAVIIWNIILKGHRIRFEIDYWKYSIYFGTPIVFHALSQQIIGHSDRVMMQILETPPSEIGIYSFVYAFVSVLSAILNALNTSWVPFLYDDLSKKEINKLNVKVKNYCQLFTVVIIGFLMLSREVVYFFAGKEYIDGVTLVPLLVMVIYLTFIYQFAVNFELYKTKPNIVAIGTVISATINVCLNAVLIPKYGMYGATIATLLSYIALAVLHMIIVNNWKHEKYPLTLYPLIIDLLFVLVACILFYILKHYWYIRWFIAATLGMFMVITIIKRKSVF